MTKTILIMFAMLAFQGCASFKEFYGENWYQGWNCYQRYGTDVCSALEKMGDK
jgi:hypothetical protein